MGGGQQMRNKPDISGFSEVDAFINAPNTVVKHETRVSRVEKEQKAFRLPVPLVLALRKKAYSMSLDSDVRVTETDLVIEALTKYLN